MENGGCWEITGEQTRGVGKQSRSRVQDGQAEEGDRPHTVEDLQRFDVKSLFGMIWDGVWDDAWDDAWDGLE